MAPPAQDISSSNDSKEGGDSIETAQQNGIAEEVSHSSAEAKEMASDVTEGATVDEEGCDTNKLDSDSNMEGSAIDKSHVDNSSGLFW